MRLQHGEVVRMDSVVLIANAITAFANLITALINLMRKVKSTQGRHFRSNGPS